jgi:beta-lactam-binding protein with PASTA domain
MAFEFLKPATKRDVYLHLLIVVLTAAVLMVVFFNLYLPFTTNHGQTITVPNLQGMHRDQLEEFLESRDLEYQVDDSAYNAGMAAFLVYQQYPLPGSKVKKGRKIYVSINSSKPPLVKMPNLINRSYLNAQRELENNGLLLGETKLIPDLQFNAVLKQQTGGQDVQPGTSIRKGTRIDLVIGDGLSNRELDVPDLKGMPLDEAIALLQGSGLQKGTVIGENNPSVPRNAVIRQKPEAGSRIKEGDVVDVWISGETTNQTENEITE